MRFRFFTGLAVLLSLGAQGLLAQQPTSSSDALARGDHLFTEKSYSLALKAYDEAERAGRVPHSRREEVRLRMVRCLAAAERWDEALAASARIAERNAGTVWEVRSRALRMELYLRAPNYAWKVVDHLYYDPSGPPEGTPVPASRAYVEAESRAGAVREGEQARVLCEKLRGQLQPGEESDLCADLARAIAGSEMEVWAQERKWPPPGDSVWILAPAQPYDATWPPPRKVQQLLAAAELRGTQGQKPVARLYRALWLRSFHALMERRAWTVDRVLKKAVPKPYPYQDEDPAELLLGLAHDYPADAEADHSRVLAAWWWIAARRYTEALRLVRGYLQEKPGGPQAGQARRVEALITRPEVRISPPRPKPAGQPARLEVHFRNLRSVRFTAHRVLFDQLAQRRFRQTQRLDFNFLPNVDLKEFRRFEVGEPIAWEAELAGDSQNGGRKTTVETPNLPAGAYLVEASGPDTRSLVLLFVSDLAVVELIQDHRVTTFVADALTGAPIPNARVLCAQRSKVTVKGRDEDRVRVDESLSSGDGTVDFRREARSGSAQDVEVLAWVGERYAFTVDSPWDEVPPPGEEREGKVYTDRPVYRPGQKVFFRALLAHQPPGRLYQPEPGIPITIKLVDPHWTEIRSLRLNTGNYGTADGSFDLPQAAALGTYRLSLEDSRGTVTTGNLRVEEYKKPEFEVTVEPAEVVEGRPTAARVKARYYFGTPVAGARVRCVVERRPWSADSPFEDDELLSSAESNDYDDVPRGLQAWVPERLEGITDARGEFLVPLKFPDPRMRRMNLMFSIGADVTDASRRAIEGEGEIPIRGTEFDAFLGFRQGFFPVGETLRAEIRTLDGERRPVAVAGTCRIYRVTTPYEAFREQTELVRELPLRTGADGSAQLVWKPDGGGRYRVRFEARDSRGSRVSAAASTWVAGEGASVSLQPNERIRLIPLRSRGDVGTSIPVLAVAQPGGVRALQVREVGRDIGERWALSFDSETQVLEVPITERDVPEVRLAVYGVRDFAPLRAELALDARPPDRALTVEITPDRATCRPGEASRLHVRARDRFGRPVQAAFSVAAFDSSLLYINSEDGGSLFYQFFGGSRNNRISDSDSLGMEFIGTDTSRELPGQGSIDWKLPPGLGAVPLEVWQRTYNGWWDLRFWAYQDFQGTVQGNPGSGYMAGMDAPPEFGAPESAGPNGPRGPTGPPGPPGVSPAELAEIRATAGFPGGPRTRLEAAVARIPSITGAVNVPPSPETPEPLRRNFADTAVWVPEVITDDKGEAVVPAVWPDNLTRWHIRARGWTREGVVGEATAAVTTAKELIVRLQSPRFFVERDEVVLSANVHNYAPREREISVALELPDKGALASDGPAPGSRTIRVPAGGESRLDWRVRAARSGQAVVRVTARSGEAADGVEQAFPVRVHGVEQLVTRSGVLTDRMNAARFDLPLPAHRALDTGELVVDVTPSVAASILDALPYLVDFPYGCVEQTMGRFLPAVVCAHTLKDLRIDLDDLRRRSEAEYARILKEKPTDRPANSGYTYSEGAAGLRDARRMQLELWRWRAERSPVYRPEILDAVTTDGLARLAQMQHGDGGWGWWTADGSDPYMTAYVLRGLLLARQAGRELPPQMLERGLSHLADRLTTEREPHQLAFEAWVLSLEPKYSAATTLALINRVYPARENLSPYGLALAAMALDQVGRAEDARVCLRNLETKVRVDPGSGAVSWVAGGSTWEWYRNPVETSAACLSAFLRLEPNHRFIPGIVRWLIANRRGSAWGTTRETALATEALAEYLARTHELDAACTVTVEVGTVRREFRIDRANALLFDNRLVVPMAGLEGSHPTVRLTRSGGGTVYYSAYLRYFTLEENIPAAATDLRVHRRYFRVVPNPNNTTPGGPDAVLRSELRPGETLESGDLVEVELQIESGNQYSYLVFEDMKPAGCEPVAIRSGGAWQNGLCSNMELRDEKVAFFVTQLPQGRQVITYQVRAEIPGAFHALPLNAYAMYAPEVRATSAENRLLLRDRRETGTGKDRRRTDRNAPTSGSNGSPNATRGGES